jgi:hypothetical protein
VTARREDPARLRTRRSIVFGIVSAITGASLWRWLLTREEEQGTPWPFRRVLELNGRIAHRLFSGTREAPAPRVANPTPRVNGDIGLEGPVDPAHWKLGVEAAGAPLASFSLEDIHALPRSSALVEFKCIEGWSDAFSYTGVRFSDFVAELSRRTGRADLGDFKYVGLETPDREYYVSIDRESMLHPQTLLAYEMAGGPLSADHGAPLRLVIPVKYGIKSLKRIGRIFFSDARPPDYWAEQGYDWHAGL